MPLDRHAQGRQEPLGRVEVHHDPLIRLDVLAAGGERLRIQAEVEDDFLGSRRDSAEIGVRRQRPRIVDDDLGCAGLRSSARAGRLGPSFSLISFSQFFMNGAHALERDRPRCTRGAEPLRSRVIQYGPYFSESTVKTQASGHAAVWASDDSTSRSSSARVRPAAPCWARTKSRPAGPAGGRGLGIVEIGQQARGQLVGVGDLPRGVAPSNWSTVSRKLAMCGPNITDAP